MLERLFLDGPETPHEAKALSTETLLDILLILYNECCNSSLRKEKTLTDFIELGRTSNLFRRAPSVRGQILNAHYWFYSYNIRGPICWFFVLSLSLD